MTKQERRERADAVADQHGCAIQPSGDGRLVLVVLGYYSAGNPGEQQE